MDLSYWAQHSIPYCVGSQYNEDHIVNHYRVLDADRVWRCIEGAYRLGWRTWHYSRKDKRRYRHAVKTEWKCRRLYRLINPMVYTVNTYLMLIMEGESGYAVLAPTSSWVDLGDKCQARITEKEIIVTRR